MTPEQETALQGLLAELQKRKEEGTPVNQPRKPVVSPSATESTYQIMPGDTLSGIAEKQGISIEDLMTVNPNITDPNKIYAGSVLNLPGQPKKEVMIGEEPAEEKPVEEKTDYDLLQEEIDKSNMAFSNLFQSAGINGVNMETSIADIVKQISDLYGFPDINKQLEEIDNKYIDEEVDINNNPWLTESMRSRKITALQQKYEGKREALINRLSTEKSIVGEAINYYYKEKEYQKDLLFKQLSLKSQEIDEKKAGFSLSAGQARYEYNPDTGKYEQVASVGKTTEPTGETIKSGGLVISGGNVSDMQKQLDATRGKDGYANTATYLDLLDEWKNKNGLEEDFFSRFSPKNYLNPNDPTVPQYIKDKLKKASGDFFDDL
jgi:LysM repeat protein